MAIKGTVTRVVDDVQGKRVFIQPDDPSALRDLDGSQFCATGEVPCPVSDLTSYKVGEDAELDPAPAKK